MNKLETKRQERLKKLKLKCINLNGKVKVKKKKNASVLDLGYRSLTMAEFYSIYRQDSFQNCPLMTANVTFLLHFFFHLALQLTL